MSGIDKAKDKGQELGGKAKETAGDATGNDDLKAEATRPRATSSKPARKSKTSSSKPGTPST
jgi:uncharacterized protein YjbJ (UPF0337 family)